MLALEGQFDIYSQSVALRVTGNIQSVMDGRKGTVIRCGSRGLRVVKLFGIEG
jgi:hypothetical protein